MKYYFVTVSFTHGGDLCYETNKNDFKVFMIFKDFMILKSYYIYIYIYLLDKFFL